jgi:hypothetical protein
MFGRMGGAKQQDDIGVVNSLVFSPYTEITYRMVLVQRWLDSAGMTEFAPAHAAP